MKKILMIAALAGALAITGMAIAANQEGGDDPPIDNGSIVLVAPGVGRCRVAARNELDDANLAILWRIDESIGDDNDSIDVKVAGKSGNVMATCSRTGGDARRVARILNRFNNGSAEPISIEICTIIDRQNQLAVKGTGHVTLAPGGNFTMHCSGNLNN